LTIQEIFEEERNEIIEEFKKQYNIDFQKISEKYLIHESILIEIYKNDYYD
jgi:hypothetical protein